MEELGYQMRREVRELKESGNQLTEVGVVGGRGTKGELALGGLSVSFQIGGPPSSPGVFIGCSWYVMRGPCFTGIMGCESFHLTPMGS